MPGKLRKTSSLLILPLAALLSAVPAFGLPPSNSKLGIHLIQNNTAGITQICNAHPRVIKILDVHGPMLDAARHYKSVTPEGIVVLRVYTTKRYSFSDNPAASASDFAATVLMPALNSLSAADRALIDYVEGPNECDSTPCWVTLQDAQWFSDFWVALAPLIADAGFKPCGFSMPIGNPPGDQVEMRQKLAAIVPALRACKQRGGAWSYHAYTPSWSTDVNYQQWYSLRYRQFYSYFVQNYPDLADMPLILTEAGFDSGGSPTGSGWQANGTASQYQTWLTWWDAQIRQDSYVVGSTLFQIGSPATWPSFDVEPIAGWLAQYLDDNLPVILSCSPAAINVSVIKGHEANPTSFVVTNSGYHSMDYSINDNAVWMSVSPTSGTSSGESDTIAVTFTTAGLNAGIYYGRITITASAEQSPQFINVMLTVREQPIPGDLNDDRYVDRDDIAIFLSCMTGAEVPFTNPQCVVADIDTDNDVDQSDFGIMQKCIRGDMVLGDPNCAD